MIYHKSKGSFVFYYVQNIWQTSSGNQITSVGYWVFWYFWQTINWSIGWFPPSPTIVLAYMCFNIFQTWILNILKNQLMLPSIQSKSSQVKMYVCTLHVIKKTNQCFYCVYVWTVIHVYFNWMRMFLMDQISIFFNL